MFASTSCLKRNMTRARVSGGVAAQPGKAAAATCDGRVDLGLAGQRDRAWTSPVAGLKTSPKRPLLPSTVLPLMKWGMVLLMMVSTPSAARPEPALPGLDYGSDRAHSSDWAGADKEPNAAHIGGQSGRRRAPSLQGKVPCGTR